MNFRSKKAFTLLELMLVAAGILLLAGVWLHDSVKTVVTKKLGAEDEILAQISRDINHSFEDADFTNINIASLTGEIAVTDTPTAFSASTAPSYTTTNANDWFAKIARYRGTPISTGIAPSRIAQPELARIVFNSYDQPRFLFVGPAETGQQRYLLVSLMARSDELVLPTFQATSAWFDALWNTDFAASTGTAPGAWGPLMTATQLSAWTGNLHRLRVVRITQKRWALTVNNNHLTMGAWAYWPNGTMQFLANSGSGT